MKVERGPSASVLMVPDHVGRPAGCTCRGLDWHRDGCALMGLPVGERVRRCQAAWDELLRWQPLPTGTVDGR